MDNMLRTFGDYVQGCPNAEPLLVYRRPAGAIEMFRPGMAARTPYLHALTDVTVTRERQHHTLYDGIRNILFAGAPSKATALPTDDTVETPAPVPAAPPRASDALREDLAAEESLLLAGERREHDRGIEAVVRENPRGFDHGGAA